MRNLIPAMVVVGSALAISASAQDAGQPNTKHRSKHAMAMPGMQSHDVHTPVADLRNALVGAWNARDVQKLAGLYSESAVIILPTGRLVTGRQSIREYLEQMSARKSQVSLTSMGGNLSSELQVDFGYFVETKSGTADHNHAGDQETEGRYLMVAKQYGSEWKIQEQVLTLLDRNTP